MDLRNRTENSITNKQYTVIKITSLTVPSRKSKAETSFFSVTPGPGESLLEVQTDNEAKS